MDRSASYAARWVAKHVVAAGIASRCEVQVAYAIGVAHPISLLVQTFGTSDIEEPAIEKAVREVFDLRPAAIVRDFDLMRPIYAAQLPTATSGARTRSSPGSTLRAWTISGVPCRCDVRVVVNPAASGGGGRTLADPSIGRAASVACCRSTEAIRLVVADLPALNKQFVYSVPRSLSTGRRGTRRCESTCTGRRVGGWVIDLPTEAPAGVAVRSIAAVRGIGPPNPVVDMARWASWRWAGAMAFGLRTASSDKVVARLPVRAPSVLVRLHLELTRENRGSLRRSSRR